jgi:RES domain-containing protein
LEIEPNEEFCGIEAALRACSYGAAPWIGTVYRSATPRYSDAHDMVTGIGSARVGGRWNPRASFPTVYASLDPETAMSESMATFRYYGLPPHSALPRLFRAIEVKLAAMLDLREVPLANPLPFWVRLGLREDWRALQDHGRESTSQAIGRAAWLAGLEGLIVPSRASPKGSNAVLFPENLRPGSQIQALG